MSIREHEAELHAELGYRMAGRRELSLRDWLSLRGDAGEVAPTAKAFAALVNRLRVKKWSQDHPDRKSASSLRWALSPRGRAANVGNARKRRRAKFVADARVITCADCGVEFCEAQPRAGKPRRYCTDRCRAAAVKRRWRRAAGQAEHRCGVCSGRGHNARRHA